MCVTAWICLAALTLRKISSGFFSFFFGRILRLLFDLLFSFYFCYLFNFLFCTCEIMLSVLQLCHFVFLAPSLSLLGVQSSHLHKHLQSFVFSACYFPFYMAASVPCYISSFLQFHSLKSSKRKMLSSLFHRGEASNLRACRFPVILRKPGN